MKKLFLITISLVLAVSAIAFTFSACNTEESSEAVETISFTDALGRKIELKNKPERVAALLGSFADVWMLSGGEICATTDDAWEDFELELPNAQNIGGSHSVNLEMLLSAKPDFVIASSSTSSNVEMKDVLENAGIKVAYFDVDNFYDYLSMLDICTNITGRKDLYKENGLDIKEKIDKIKAECVSKNIPDKKRSVLLLRASSGVKVKNSKGTILGEMLADLGCINIADNDDSLLENLNIENIIKEDPYRVFVVTMGNDTKKAMDNVEKMMKENPAWGTLEAIKNDRYYVMERKLFNNKPNADWAESYEKLKEILLDEK